MIREGKIGVQEATYIIIIVILMKPFFSNPATIADTYGTAGWYATLVSTTVAIIGFTFVYFLLKRFAGKNIIEIYNIAMGRFIGNIFSALFCIFFLLDASLSSREFTEAAKTYVFPLTPTHYIIGILTLCVVLASYLGLETIVRASSLFSYILLFGITIVLVLASKNYDYHNLFPIFGYGIKKTVLIGAARSTTYGEVLILAVIAGSLQGIKHIKKAGYISLILSGISASIILLSFTLTFPYFAAREVMSPMYQMTTLIEYGAFFQRLDPIFLFIWNISALLTATILFYTAVSIYCKMFKIQDMHPVILPFAIIFFTIALLPKDSVTVATGFLQEIRKYGWTILFGCPLIALISAMLRKKGNGKESA